EAKRRLERHPWLASVDVRHVVGVDAERRAGALDERGDVAGVIVVVVRRDDRAQVFGAMADLGDRFEDTVGDVAGAGIDERQRARFFEDVAAAGLEAADREYAGRDFERAASVEPSGSGGSGVRVKNAHAR